MTVHELRIRYAVPEMFHSNDRSRDIIHAIICNIYTISKYVTEIREVGYRIVGYDERLRDDKTYISPFDGWNEIKVSRAGVLEDATTH